MSKQTITLCMIVKDEAHVIARAFDSVREFVDYYIICDTGSTDSTKEVIKAYWKQHGLKGEVHEHDWVNFGRNRTQCFELAKGKSDYIMTLDADEVIAPYKDGIANLFSKIVELPELTTDMVYATTVLGETQYQRAQFFRNGIDWTWTEPVHEMCTSPFAISLAWLEDLCCVASAQDGGRSKDPGKFKKDAELLEEYLISHPKDSRSWFYLAQSLGDSGDLERAITSIDTALDFLDWDQEIYIALLRKARWKLLKTKNIEDAVYDYLLAYSFMPSRAEALYDLVRWYSRLGDYACAALFGEAGLRCPHPSKESLFVERDIYTWKLKDITSVAYYYLGDERARVLFQELLDSTTLPDDHRKRIKNNLLEGENNDD